MKLAHSYSSLDTYEKCPLKYYYLKIEKSVKDSGNEFTRYGERVHEGLAKRLLSNEPLPEDLEQYEGLCATIKGKNPVLNAEIRMCINENLEPTEWFSADAWLRSIVDILIVDHNNATATVMDWKTGKPNKNYNQLKLFALQVFQHYPQVDKVKTAFIWLKDKSINSKVYVRGDMGTMWETVLNKIDRVKQSVKYDKWPPKPSGLCRYCPANKICDFAQV